MHSRLMNRYIQQWRRLPNCQVCRRCDQSREMEVGSVVQEDITFRGVGFAVKIELEEGLLIVEISDAMTADQWRGEFDPAYIEDLTRKTGNFKQFPIFCSMLESAVSNSSESVTLDLLTYADLELLRNRKAGVVGRPRAQQQSPNLSAKRYLILIYTVEFDRIHYPLPLPYHGKPDPAALQKEIRALKTELNAIANHAGHKPAEPEIRRLRAELALVREEKEALTKALERLQIVGVGSTSGGGARGLREVVRSLEDQLLRERAKSQRSATKRGQEQRLLLEQLEELRASERALRIRVKSLTNELALLRRGLVNLSIRLTPALSGRSASRGDGEIRRSLSRERSLGRVVVRAHSGSRERTEERGRRSEGRRADSSGPRSHVSRPSPSPTGSRAPRFDPTAYIQDRQRRLREGELKNQRKVRRDMLASPVLERGRSRSREAYPQLTRAGSGSRGRSLSIESRRSKQSSVNSLDELTIGGRKQTYNGPTMPRGNLTRKPHCSTPTRRIRSDKEGSIDGADLSEIDARLQALQDYMRDLDTGH
ncbi:centrosomal protein CCDC61 isoform X1 [Salvelinus sp. IW2-2015]|uniref:centrosomal protein CCDC61 isoform X1 n=2 Tax=Salvelinus sp. IW2-2015 TaxID=2691554 RepID=UPI000CDF8168|nr:coiled-coil domain-containing protein 61 isoform X1 [Salvelinus alpinus]